MSVALVFLAIMIALTTALGLVRSNLAAGLVCALLGVAVIAMALSLRPGAIGRLSRIFRPALLVVLIAPPLWMLLQVTPLPVRWLSDSVWASTSSALNLPIAGAITIDIGATLLSFVRYCAVLATAMLVAALTIDRQMAENTLYSLTAIAGLAAGLQIISELGYLGPPGVRPAGGDEGAALIAAIGIILSCASVIQVREQFFAERRELKPRATVVLAVATAALLICLARILIQYEVTVIFAAAFGAGVPISVLAIRRWLLGTWGQAGIVAAAVMILLGFLSVAPMKKDADPATALSQKSRVATELMLSDARLLGYGAGTFEYLLPIYRTFDEGSSRGSETAAAIITIDMGRAFLWTLVLGLVTGVALLIRGSLARNRDYVYAGAGAGILLAISIMTFVNGDLLSLGASSLAGAALGLAWAQSRSSNSEEVPAGGRIRLVSALFGLLLTAEAAWVLVGERFSSAAIASPFEKTRQAVSFEEIQDLENAASRAAVRGDLWAKSAFAAASLQRPNSDSDHDRVRSDLLQALRYAPHRSDVWLTFAVLAERDKRDLNELRPLLKMAYYTGPNETALIPARIRLALSVTDATTDFELEDMIRRDVTLILTRLPALKPTFAEAYKSAGPDGRALAQRLVSQLDPAFLATLGGD